MSLTSSTRAIPNSLFGMHIHQALKTWPIVPFHSWRLWDAYVSWADLEPEPNQWNFNLLDQYVELAAKKNVELVLTLGQSPQWASARPTDESPYGPGRSAEPRNLEDWRRYIHTVATRYKGRIHYYEMWNEPNYKMFYTGSPEMLVQLTREAAAVLKKVDPSIALLSPPFSGGEKQELEWLKSFLSQGGGKVVDIIAYHFYPGSSTPPGLEAEKLVPYIDKVKTVLAQYDVANKPLWNTESGWLKPIPVETDQHALAKVARAYLINWAMGVERVYWYAWDNQAAVNLYFTQADGKTPTPATQGYIQIQKWLVGAKMKQCTSDKDQTWVCAFSRQGTPFLIVWNPTQTKTIPVPETWAVQYIQDLLGKSSAIASSRQITVDFSPQLLTPNKPT